MKRRPLLAVSSLFIVGILLGRYISISIPLLWLFILTTTLLIFGIIAVLALRYRRIGKLLIALTFISLGAYGYSSSLLPAEKLYSQIDKIKSVQGRVINYPTQKQGRSTFVIKPEGEQGYLKVFYYHPNSSHWLRIEYGDKLWLGGEFEIPWEFEDFNYREYLLRRDIWAVVSIWGRSQIRKLASNQGNPILQLGFRLRNYLFRVIDDFITAPENQLIKALVFGERAYLSEDIETSFRDAGIMHVLAVSGLHLGIIIGILWWMLRQVEIFITKLAEMDYPIFRNPFVVEKFRLSATRIYLIILPLVVFYLLIVGFRISLLRASLLFAFLTLGMVAADLRLIVKKWADPLAGLAAACWLILLIEPKSLFDIGFQLSFSATLLILLFLPLIKRILNRLPELKIENAGKIKSTTLSLFRSSQAFVISLLIISLAAQLGVIPFIAFHFGRIYCLVILANLLIIPLVIVNLWVGLILLIAGALHLTTLAGLVGIVEGGLLRLLTQVARFFGKSSLSYLEMNFNLIFYLSYGFSVLTLIWALYKVFPNGSASSD